MIIFSPGPANISKRVRKALSKPDICHRDTEFSNILSNVRRMILEISKVSDGYECILFAGSGTLAMESVISSFGGYDKKILIISNGIYGERVANIARLFNIKMEQIRLEWGVLPDLVQIENRLKDKEFGSIYIVHHETTTGLLNPLEQICTIARRYGKLVLTDAISSFAGERLDISGWGIDALISSANKCIRGVPGVSFVVASRRFIETIKKCKSLSFYADLLFHLNCEIKGETPFTPPVQAFYALEEALKELIEQGPEARIRHYQEISGFLRQGLKDLGLRFYIREESMSNTMTTVYMPGGLNYSVLHDEFKKRGFAIYASAGELCDTTFRLGTVGLISKKDIARFLKVFRELL